MKDLIEQERKAWDNYCRECDMMGASNPATKRAFDAWIVAFRERYKLDD